MNGKLHVVGTCPDSWVQALGFCSPLQCLAHHKCQEVPLPCSLQVVTPSQHSTFINCVSGICFLSHLGLGDHRWGSSQALLGPANS